MLFVIETDSRAFWLEENKEQYTKFRMYRDKKLSFYPQDFALGP